MTDRLSITVLRAAKAGKQALIDLVLPPVCRLCGEPVDGADDFCRSCLRALTMSQPWMRHSCNRCGMPHPAVKRPDENGPWQRDGHQEQGMELEAAATAMLHQDCVHCRGSSFAFDGVTALWAYQGRVCDAVVAAKYPQNAALGDALGRRLAQAILERSTEHLPDIVTYVPSYLTRSLARGGTGTAVIAAAVARCIARPCRSLVRATRPIAKQAWLDDEAREKNVHDAFSAKRSYAFARTPQPPNRQILIVDDVLTTGATANEVARVLRGVGGNRVSLAVVARAIRSR